MHRSKTTPAARSVQRIYERRPYPPADGSAATKARSSLPPIEWIDALWKPGREAKAPERILVAGCGTGREAFGMRRAFPQAEIVAFDFTATSIELARDLQRRAPSLRSIRFLIADLTDRRLPEKIGGDFDFASCHGVLSSVPAPERALRNLARTLTPDGALYLGVNGARHFSVDLRRALPELGFDVAELRDGPRLRRALALCDAMQGNRGAGRVARFADFHLAGDLFGPPLRNLPLAAWMRMARSAGLHFQGDLSTFEALRAPFEEALGRLLLPKSRAEVAELAALVRPPAFHRLLFTRRSPRNPPWLDHGALLGWVPVRTRLYEADLPRRSRLPHASRRIRLDSRALNTRLDWRMPDWQAEILRQSSGRRTLGAILEPVLAAVTPALLCEELYTLHQLLVGTLVPEPVGTAS